MVLPYLEKTPIIDKMSNVHAHVAHALWIIYIKLGVRWTPFVFGIYYITYCYEECEQYYGFGDDRPRAR